MGLKSHCSWHLKAWYSSCALGPPSMPGVNLLSLYTISYFLGVMNGLLGSKMQLGRDFTSSAVIRCSVTGSGGLDICKWAGIKISCDVGNGLRANDNSTLSTARPCFSLLNSDYHSRLFRSPHFSGFSHLFCTCLHVCFGVCVCVWESQILYGPLWLLDTYLSCVFKNLKFSLQASVQHEMSHECELMDLRRMWCWHTHHSTWPRPLSFCSRDAYSPWQIRALVVVYV